LYEAGWIHGDLRLCNVIFLWGDTVDVDLIDFDWSGRFGEATFPHNVRTASFETRAREMIQPSKPIPEVFDWVCLSDIFSSLGCIEAAKFAEDQNFERIEQSLKSKAEWTRPTQYPNCLDLNCLGIHYYSREMEGVETRRRKAESHGSSSSSGKEKRASASH
jgi:hypothetical protein